MSTRIAVLGTGKMGGTIARRLAETGYDVTVWNRTRSRAEQVGAGTVAATAAGAVADVEFVISSLTGPEAVREAYIGPSGALEASHGQLFLEMSTAGPNVLNDLAPRVEASGSRLVDAPISGVPPLVARGAALIMVGGREDDVSRARLILEAFGEVRHVGPLGSGARLKLVTNSMLGVLTVGAAEMMVAGEAAGLGREAIFGVLTRLVPALEIRRDGLVGGRQDPPLFALRDLHKDLDLALGMFHSTAAAVPVTALTRELVAEAAAAAPDADIIEVTRRYRRPD